MERETGTQSLGWWLRGEETESGVMQTWGRGQLCRAECVGNYLQARERNLQVEVKRSDVDTTRKCILPMRSCCL